MPRITPGLGRGAMSMNGTPQRRVLQMIRKATRTMKERCNLSVIADVIAIVSLFSVFFLFFLDFYLLERFLRLRRARSYLSLWTHPFTRHTHSLRFLSLSRPVHPFFFSLFHACFLSCTFMHPFPLSLTFYSHTLHVSN